LKPEEFIIRCLKKNQTKFVASLPCEKVRSLLETIPLHFKHVHLNREEEGVGICAGAYLAGQRGSMLVQTSGMGNMINALCSLTKIYSMPLPIFVSWRGVYQEGIMAQEPMGKYMPGLAKAINIPCAEIREKDDIHLIEESVKSSYENEEIQLILLSPRIWDSTRLKDINNNKRGKFSSEFTSKNIKADLTRYEVIEAAKNYLENKAVVCNLGFPSKELYMLKDQPSNFYMLGSMGMATPIGLGMAMYTSKEVVVIDGDGSILMNPGILATIAEQYPKNLTILAIDNAAYGSTGNQSTSTLMNVDIEMLGKSMGIKKTFKVGTKKDIEDTLTQLDTGPNLVHIVAKAGNKEVPRIPLSPLEIKSRVMEFLQE
jgi:sulfopyruvate decarboxylase subunit beta|tara:strand:- start:2103 stop:3218 length:1116 start_codon:yes stop_codon:yes gene_type:complete